LWLRQRWTGVPSPKPRSIAFRNAFDPSITNDRRRVVLPLAVLIQPRLDVQEAPCEPPAIAGEGAGFGDDGAEGGVIDMVDHDTGIVNQVADGVQAEVPEEDIPMVFGMRFAPS